MLFIVDNIIIALPVCPNIWNYNTNKTILHSNSYYFTKDNTHTIFLIFTPCQWNCFLEIKKLITIYFNEFINNISTDMCYLRIFIDNFCGWNGELC